MTPISIINCSEVRGTPPQLNSAQLSLFFPPPPLVCPELVESGTANVTDPIALGRSHAQLRRMLRKNKKKDVDQKVRNVFDVRSGLSAMLPTRN